MHQSEDYNDVTMYGMYVTMYVCMVEVPICNVVYMELGIEK